MFVYIYLNYVMTQLYLIFSIENCITVPLHVCDLKNIVLFFPGSIVFRRSAK